MHSSSHAFQSKIATAALVLMLVAIWLLLRGYHGLLGDAQLYAFQALARIHPQLANDLYLQNTSQDQFTIFSPVYAWFIEVLGLEHAARLLTLVFTVWFLGAAWATARNLTGRDGAWLAVAFLLIASGSYGGSSVFRFADEFLTARLLAEALVVTSLACYLGGLRRLAIVVAAATLFVHPLIALPGILLLVSLGMRIWVSLIVALACAIIALLIAVGATHVPWLSSIFPVMDQAWLNIVQERSQFLFLQLWSFSDWELNVRPFFYLAFTALVIKDDRFRRLCMAAVIVGATGLAVALIASVPGPVAILVQGQAWRWIWIATFLSALLLPATILHIRQDKTRGPLCTILLISGMTLSPIDGTACVSLAMIFWLTRLNITVRAKIFVRWASFVVVGGILAWIVIQSWRNVAAILHTSEGMGTAQLHEVFGTKFAVASATAFIWWCIRSSRSVWAPTLLSLVLLSLSMFIVPAAFKQSRTLASPTDISEFSAWKGAIPTTSTVLVTPARDAGTFVWFTLQRPNFLAIDQSAGVVFSRLTALEIQRRSQILLPVMDPNWKILTNLRTSATSRRKTDAPTRPLTTERLRQICTDSQLGFVIAADEIDIHHLRHENAGSWNGWNLYDCSKMRPPASAK